MVIAQPVVTETGQLLLQKGLPLTDNLVRRLSRWPVPNVSVRLPEKVRYADPDFCRKYNETLELIASAFEKTRIFKEVPIAECKEIVNNYIELMIDIVGVVDSLYQVKDHNEYTFRHSLNVAIMAGILGKWLGFAGQQLKDIILAGLLHDIGKIMIPQSILDKPGKLTDEEMDIVKTHPKIGDQLIAGASELSQAVKLGILQHHERSDGSGYPAGLVYGDIHICARIVAIADVYDAMTTERVYRKQMPPFTAVEIIIEEMYDKLDPELCCTFITNMRRTLIGSSVLLSDGNKARVVLLHDLLSTRPIVQLETGYVMDLEKNRGINVVALLEENTA